jgi:hypothetical protein
MIFPLLQNIYTILFILFLFAMKLWVHINIYAFRLAMCSRMIIALLILVALFLSLFSFKCCYTTSLSEKLLWLLWKRILKIPVCKLTFCVLIFTWETDIVIKFIILNNFIFKIVDLWIMTGFIVVSIRMVLFSFIYGMHRPDLKVSLNRIIFWKCSRVIESCKNSYTVVPRSYKLLVLLCWLKLISLWKIISI